MKRTMRLCWDCQKRMVYAPNDPDVAVYCPDCAVDDETMEFITKLESTPSEGTRS